MGSGVIIRGHRTFQGLPRAAARSTWRSSQSVHHLALPLILSNGLADACRAAKYLEFRLGLRRVDIRYPILRARHWPGSEPGRPRIITETKTGPGPVFCTGHQRGTQRIAFDVPAHPEEMMVAGNRYSLEPPLVDRPLTVSATRRLPSTGMGRGEPMHKARQSPVGRGRQQQMPMVRHETVRKNCNVPTTDCTGENVLESRVILRMFEEHRAFCAAIQYVKHKTAAGDPWTSGHDCDHQAISVPRCNSVSSRNDSRPH